MNFLNYKIIGAPKKLKNQLRPLDRPGSVNVCQNFWNLSHETVPLKVEICKNCKLFFIKEGDRNRTSHKNQALWCEPLAMESLLCGKPAIVCYTQSNDWYIGPAELFQLSANSGSSHRRKGAASHIIDMTWLYISLAYRSGEERGVLLVQIKTTCLRAPRGRGGGSQLPVLLLDSDCCYYSLWILRLAIIFFVCDFGHYPQQVSSCKFSFTETDRAVQIQCGEIRKTKIDRAARLQIIAQVSRKPVSCYWGRGGAEDRNWFLHQ